LRFLGFFLVVISAISFGLMPIFASFAFKYGLDVKGKLLVILIFMGAVLYSTQAFSYFTSVSL